MDLFFEEQFINDVKDRNDIVDVISQYVTLKKSGNGFSGLCPFHSERTPSFTVSPGIQLYHCFGCGAGGTVINFIEEIENLDFVETVKFLAERAGLTLPDEKDDSAEQSRQKKNILEMNKLAGRAFFRNLNSPDGKTALSYLRNRGLADDTIKTYGLGFSLDKWDFLYKRLKESGYKDEDILKSGLCIEKNGKIFDFFRNRVMFPVMDVRGNVIAFGGRILGEGNPKYINTGETPIFFKRKNLFSLNNAKSSGQDYMILAEGYMDVIALYQAGFTNAVASLGTAFCDDHSRLLKRFTDKVIVSFDSDGAGIAAAKKAVDILKKDGITVRVLKMTGAKDPDELIKRFGREAYLDAISNAMSGIDYELSQIMPPGGLSDDESRIDYVKNAVKILKDINNELEQEVYIKKVSETAAVSYETIRARVKRARSDRKFENLPEYKTAFLKKKNASSALLKLIVENPSYFPQIRGKIGIDTFNEDIHKKIFEIFSDYVDGGQKPDISMILTKLSGEDVKIASEMFIEREIFADFNTHFSELTDKLNNKKLSFESGQADEKEDILKLLEYTRKLKKGEA